MGYHTATWLSWPHKEASWPGKLRMIYAKYCEFIKILAEGELVRINVVDEQMAAFAKQQLQVAGADLSQIEFFEFGTNDAWCRDHGPAFVVNYETRQKAIVDWGYNAWGGKYPPYNLDDVVPRRLASILTCRYTTRALLWKAARLILTARAPCSPLLPACLTPTVTHI